MTITTMTQCRSCRLSLSVRTRESKLKGRVMTVPSSSIPYSVEYQTVKYRVGPCAPKQMYTNYESAILYTEH